jgi:hypothetical protein
MKKTKHTPTTASHEQTEAKAEVIKLGIDIHKRQSVVVQGLKTGPQNGSFRNGTNLSKSSSGILPLRVGNKWLEARFYSRQRPLS